MNGAAGSYTYTVDLSGKRTSVTDGAGQVTAYDYDAFGRLIAETVGSAKKTAYEYDKVGNRSKLLVSQPANAPPTAASTTTYSYDDNDRLMGKVGPEGTFTYGYNDTGNLILTLGPSGRTDLAYTFENRLSQQTLTVGQSMHWANQTLYDYDANGNRIGLERSVYNTANGTTNSQNTSYLVDENLPYAEVLEEREVGTDNQGGVHLRLMARYDIGQDRLEMDRFAYPDGATQPTVGRFFYLRDGLGSTVALTDVQGNLTDAWSYDAYGTPSQASGTTTNAFLFNGQQWDGGEGLYFLRARYYGPSTGRFLGQDPLMGSPDAPISLHRYLYVAGDPVNFIDPTGAYTQEQGHDAEAIIEAKYSLDFAADVVDEAVFYGACQQYDAKGWVQTRREGTYYKPDVFNINQKTFMEIKPFTPAKVTQGLIALRKYANAFSPSGFSADIAWEPPVVGIGPETGEIFYFLPNMRGLLLWTTKPEEILFEFAAIQALGDPLLVSTLRGIASAKPSPYSLETAQKMIMRAYPMEAAEREETTGIATMDSLMGAP